MHASMRVTKIGNTRRWRTWARLLAQRGVTARRVRAAEQILLKSNFVPFTFICNSNRWLAQIQFPLQELRHLRERFTLLAGFHNGINPRQIIMRSIEAHRKYVLTSLTEPRQRTERTAGVQPWLSERTIVHSLVERTRRMETHVRPQKYALVRKPEPATSAPSPPPSSPREWWMEHTKSAQAQRFAAPTINVEQLTETVIRRIDQRVGAWRERTGRR